MAQCADRCGSLSNVENIPCHFLPKNQPNTTQDLDFTACSMCYLLFPMAQSDTRPPHIDGEAMVENGVPFIFSESDKYHRSKDLALENL